MTTFGAVSFDQPEHAEAAKRALEREGYDVDLQGQADGSVVLAASPPAAANTAAALVERMQLLARELGGEFLGHGGLQQHPLRGHS